jgi:hypothetical protein
MRKIKLFGLSLITGLILSGSSAFAQGEVGVMGFMSGRITKAEGRGIGGAVISVVAIGSCFEWEGNTVRTNPFGYYRIYVHHDCDLMVTVNRKSMIFSPNSVIIPIGNGYENINFSAN